VKIGEELTLAIIQLDAKKERIALSKKALEDNPWKNVSIKRGDVVSAKVTAVSKEGVKVEVQGVEGDIQASELAVEKINKPEDYFAVGDEVNAVVTEVNRDSWSLKLSIRRILEKAERASYEQYLEEDESEKNPTLGDLFGDKLQKSKKK